MRHRPSPTLRPFYALGLIWLLLNLPLLLGLRVFPWDAMDEFYPTVFFNAYSLHHGLAPWWNPYIYAGFPQIADPQGMLFSPLLMAWMLLLSHPGVTWFTWGVLLHLLMGGAAMLAFLQRKGANTFGSLIGATVFMAGGVAASRLEHTPIVVAYGYVPVVLFMLQRFVERPGWRRGALMGLVAGAFATQLLQVTYLFALLVAAYALAATIVRWHGYRATERWRWLGGVLLAIALAGALALPQLIFSWAYIGLSNRAILPLSAAGDASLTLRAFASLLDPNALHALRGSYQGPGNRVEAFFYLGALPTLLLVGLGVAWRQPRQRRQIVFFTLVVVASTLYLLGLHTPFYGWLYAWLPGVQHFRRPSDGAYLLNFALSVLAGLGASHLRLDSPRQVRVLLSITALWLGLASLQMRDAGVPWQAATLTGALVAGVALWILRQPRGTWHTIAWLLIVLIADYRCFNLNGTFNEGRDYARHFRRDTAQRFIESRLGQAVGLKDRVENVDAGAMWDNLVMVTGIPSTQGYNPLRYSLYQQWYGARDNSSVPRVDTPFNHSPSSKLSDLLSVRYLIKHRGEGDTWAPPRDYTLAFADEWTQVWRNERAYPRLLTPVQAQTPLGATPTPAQFEATDFRHTLWLTPRDAADREAAIAAATQCRARVAVDQLHATPTHVVMNTRAAAPGWLVLGDLDFPGWQANIDGRAVAIHRANGMFRAVCVPAGDHTVGFSFHPWAMVAQAWRERPRS